jgi:hypothetical protein
VLGPTHVAVASSITVERQEAPAPSRKRGARPRKARGGLIAKSPGGLIAKAPRRLPALHFPCLQGKRKKG